MEEMIQSSNTPTLRDEDDSEEPPIKRPKVRNVRKKNATLIADGDAPPFRSIPSDDSDSDNVPLGQLRQIATLVP